MKSSRRGQAPVLPHWTGFPLLGDADLGIALDGAAWAVVGYALRVGRAERLVLSGPSASRNNGCAPLV